MRSTRFLRTLFASVAVVVLALVAWPRAAVPAAQVDDGTPIAQAEIAATHYGGDSTPQHRMSSALNGEAAFDAARRIQRVRLHGAVRSMPTEDGRAPSIEAVLRLRDAGRERLDHGHDLSRDASGAAAFHINTPPPRTLV